MNEMNVCIGVLITVDTTCGDVSLFALGSDVSERSTECIFTMKEEGICVSCHVRMLSFSVDAVLRSAGEKF